MAIEIALLRGWLAFEFEFHPTAIDNFHFPRKIADLENPKDSDSLATLKVKDKMQTQLHLQTLSN